MLHVVVYLYDTNKKSLNAKIPDFNLNNYSNMSIFKFFQNNHDDTIQHTILPCRRIRAQDSYPEGSYFLIETTQSNHENDTPEIVYSFHIFITPCISYKLSDYAAYGSFIKQILTAHFNRSRVDIDIYLPNIQTVLTDYFSEPIDIEYDLVSQLDCNSVCVY